MELWSTVLGSNPAGAKKSLEFAGGQQSSRPAGGSVRRPLAGSPEPVIINDRTLSSSSKNQWKEFDQQHSIDPDSLKAHWLQTTHSSLAVCLWNMVFKRDRSVKGFMFVSKWTIINAASVYLPIYYWCYTCRGFWQVKPAKVLKMSSVCAGKMTNTDNYPLRMVS